MVWSIVLEPAKNTSASSSLSSVHDHDGPATTSVSLSLSLVSIATYKHQKVIMNRYDASKKRRRNTHASNIMAAAVRERTMYSLDVIIQQQQQQDQQQRSVLSHHHKLIRGTIFLLCLLHFKTSCLAQELTNIPSASQSPSISTSHAPAVILSSLSSGSPTLTTIASSSTSNGPTREPNPSDRNFCGTSLAVSFRQLNILAMFVQVQNRRYTTISHKFSSS
jgi:hypothetical protein